MEVARRYFNVSSQKRTSDLLRIPKCNAFFHPFRGGSLFSLAPFWMPTKYFWANSLFLVVLSFSMTISTAMTNVYIVYWVNGQWDMRNSTHSYNSFEFQPLGIHFGWLRLVIIQPRPQTIIPRRLVKNQQFSCIWPCITFLLYVLVKRRIYGKHPT